MTTTDRTPDAAVERNEFSIIEVAAFFLRHRRLIVGLSALLFAITVTVRLLATRQYVSSASFMPQSGNSLSGLGGLAAQFGVTAPGQDPNETPAFYGDLLRTREVVTTVVQSSYSFPTDSGVVTTTLLDLLPTGGGTRDMKLAKAVDLLAKSVKVDLKARTGVVSLELAMPNPVLAQQVVQRFLDEVNRFNLQRRNSKAGAERRFMEGRLAELQRELRDAEDRLQAFLSNNRDYRNSPALSFQHDRLAQDMEFRRTVFNSVAQSIEKSRMDEVRDTPVITVIEKPIAAPRPQSRGAAKYGLIALLGGAALGMGIGFVKDDVARRRTTSSSEFAEFSSYLSEARGDLETVRRGFRRKRTAP